MGGGEASHDHTSARDKMFLCQLSYSLDNVSLAPLNERLSTDINIFYRRSWVGGGEVRREAVREIPTLSVSL